MSISNCNALINEYVTWLREQITVANVDGACEITTPFLDRHNDFLQIYVIEDGDQYILTDGGYILSDLRMSGVELNSEKRLNALGTILRGFGVEKYGQELRVIAQPKLFGQKKHALIQAMLAVNDLFLVAQSRVVSFFIEDVEQYLQLHKIRFLPQVTFTGRSGYPHHFDFAIPSSQDAPERLVKALNSPTRNNISSLIFSWNDTKKSRSPNTKAYAFLNDEKSIQDESVGALRSYGITPIYWTKRDDEIGRLSV